MTDQTKRLQRLSHALQKLERLESSRSLMCHRDAADALATRDGALERLARVSLAVPELTRNARAGLVRAGALLNAAQTAAVAQDHVYRTTAQLARQTATMAERAAQTDSTVQAVHALDDTIARACAPPVPAALGGKPRARSVR